MNWEQRRRESEQNQHKSLKSLTNEGLNEYKPLAFPVLALVMMRLIWKRVQQQESCEVRATLKRKPRPQKLDHSACKPVVLQ